MAVDHIRYDLLVRGALRNVVREVLADVAKNGPPGDHHFYIAFDTRVEGVRISPRLRAQYPEEMTIILQHQFWDLTVGETGFEVGLSFNGIPERLVVPFDAMKGFADPSVQFGLEFEVATDKDASAGPAASPADGAARPAGEGAAAAPAPTRAAEPAAPSSPSPSASPPAPAAGASSGTPDKPAGGAEVVRLDRFRKK